MIRNLNLLICFSGMFLAQNLVQAQQDPSAAFEISSTTQGLLPSRMSQDQMEAIVDPAPGLLVYCNDCPDQGGLYQFSISNQWVAVALANVPTTVSDSDGNTALHAEKTPNDNTLRFEINGQDRMTLDPQGRLHLLGAFLDSSDTAGTDGQVLSTTANGTQWIDAPSPTTISDSDGSSGTTGQVLTIDQNGQIKWVSLATPSRIVNGTVTTQLRALESDNSLRFITNGVERMRLDANGHLHLQGSWADSNNSPGSAGQILSSTANGTQWVALPAAKSLSDVNSSTGQKGELLTINPNGQLQWVKPNKVKDANGQTGSAGQVLTTDTNSKTVWVDRNNLGSTPGTAGEILSINNNNRAEWQKLSELKDANGDSGTNGQILTIDQDGKLQWTDQNNPTDTAGTNGQVLVISQNGKTSWNEIEHNRIADTDGDTQIQVEESSNDNTIRMDTAGTERLLISAEGNLGIGNNNPNDRLDVVGNAHISGAYKDSSGSAGTSGQVLASTGNGTQWSPHSIITNRLTDADTDTQIQVEESTNEDKIRFDTGGVERAIIDNMGNLGLGTSSPQASAILELSSTTKGFLPPRMSTAQRDAINPKIEGMVIYNTTTFRLEVWDGSAWSM